MLSSIKPLAKITFWILHGRILKSVAGFSHLAIYEVLVQKIIAT